MKFLKVQTSNKNMTTTIVITTLIGLVLAAYGWIFRAIIRRIEKIEAKQDKNDGMFLKIQTALAQIQADLAWLKDKNKK